MKEAKPRVWDVRASSLALLLLLLRNANHVLLEGSNDTAAEPAAAGVRALLQLQLGVQLWDVLVLLQLL